MDFIGTIILVVVIVAAVLGLIIGLCKGFSNVSSWGVEYLLACICTILIGGAVKNSAGGSVAGIVCLAIGVASLMLFGWTSGLCRTIFRRSRKKKIARGKNKKETSPSGFMDVIFGGVTLAVKGAVIAGFISAFLLAALDLTQLGGLMGINGLYGGGYLAFKPYMMDCFYLAFIMLALKCGYRSGISNVLWSFIMLALVAFAAFGAYNLAFNVSAFDGVAASIAGTLQEMLSSAESILGSGLGETIARAILAVGIFLIMLVVVILIGVFVPKLLVCARGNKVFRSIDGLIGAFCAVVVVAGIMLVVGNILQPLVSNPEAYVFIANLASYFEGSAFATYFVDNNLLVLFGMPPIFDLTQFIK